MWSNAVALLLLTCDTILALAQLHHPYYYPTERCLKKVCEQVVSGRYLPYARILEIIHGKEYLDAIHISKANNNSHMHERQKRQAASASPSPVPPRIPA